jgi:predicted dehydrogenase
MTWRVGILGAGIGAQHVDGFLTLPDQFDVQTICDLQPDRGSDLARRCGAAWTDDSAAVLSDPAIDIVDICLPPHLHYQTCLDALEAGKHVICEKPLVPSLAECDRVEDVVRRTGKQVFPVFQYRYGLGTAQFHALAAAGLLGRPYVATLETHWNRGADYYAVPWRGTWKGEHGGALLGHAIHAHDLLSALLGPVDRVYARTTTRVNPIETEDCAALSLRMANGALATSSVTLGAAEDRSRLRLVFEHVTIDSDQAPYAPARNAWTFTTRDPKRQPEVDTVVNSVVENRWGYIGLFSAINEALQGKSGREVSLLDGRRSLEFVTAAYASARDGGDVALPLERHHPLYAGWQP